MSAPQSEIHILKGLRIDNRYINTLYFENATEQYNYFVSKSVRHFTNYTYLRKSWSIKVNATMETATGWNYLMFRNPGSKWWYYFITNIEYINDETVELFLEMDVIQSYLFDFHFNETFIERTHVTNDGLGKNNVPEDLEFGELVSCNVAETTELNDLCILVLTSVVPSWDNTNNTVGGTSEPLGRKLNNIFSGLAVIYVDMSNWDKLATALRESTEFNEGVVCMWVFPKALVGYNHNEHDEVFYSPYGNKSFTVTSKRPDTLGGGYVPRNKKLYNYPYNSLYVTNNAGSCGIYRYEMFGDPESIVFKVTGAISPESSPYMYPLNYKNNQRAYEEGVSLPSYPTCAWNSDTYKLWLAQNQNTQAVESAQGYGKIIGGAIAGVAGLATGNLAVAGIGGTMLLTGAQQIANQMAQKADKDVQPPEAKGNFSASTNIVAGFHKFTLIQKTVSAGWAEKVDNYFDMYGYRVNHRDVPNLRARQHFTYIKTVGANIYGNIPNDDLQKIVNIFDNGITLWSNHDNVGDYSLSETNSIIGD